MKRYLVLLIISFIFGLGTSHAFEMNPWAKRNGDVYESTLLTKTTDPIHENITMRVIKPFNKDVSIMNLIKGVRWNDDPLDQLGHGLVNLTDFGLNFVHSCGKRIKIDVTYDMLYRTHCGDMQFLHAMASSRNETATETLEKIMMWLEFTYKVSTGEISHNHSFRSIPGDYFEGDEKKKHKPHLSKISSHLFRKVILNNNNIRLMWQPEYLFTLSCNRSIFNKLNCKNEKNYNEHVIMDIALGSALHLIEDSFSNSHVSRETEYNKLESRVSNRGSIIGFHLYTEQNHKNHVKADKIIIGENETSQPGEIGMNQILTYFLEKVIADRHSGKNSWTEVSSHLKEIAFNLSNPKALPIKQGKYIK